MNYRFSLTIFRHRLSVIPILVAMAWGLACTTAKAQLDQKIQHDQPVGRHSDDRLADLIESLIVTKRLDDAESICRWKQKRDEVTSDAHARSTIKLAKVLLHRNLAANRFDEVAADASCQPIDELLTRYPDHPRSLFLRSARLDILRFATKVDVAVAALTVDDESRTTPTIKRLTRLMRATEKMFGEANEARTSDFKDDVHRLQQELLVQTVSMALLQTELFPASSPDAIAAAAKAVQESGRAQMMLPAASLARFEIERMRCEAILLSGDPRLARQECETLMQEQTGVIPPSVLALEIRIDLELGDSSKAESKLSHYFGANPLGAVGSIPMDLARLQWLLTTGQADQAGRWIQQMDDRSGPYARCRAEAIAVAFADDSADPENSLAVIVARGRQQIQRGDLVAGAKLLAKAAILETDSKRSLQTAMIAAAAFRKAEQFNLASDLLCSIAVAHSSDPDAAEVHLQGIVVLSSSPNQADHRNVETLLRSHLIRWPEMQTASSARTWLIGLLNQTNRLVDAATVATELPKFSIDPSSVKAIIDRWTLAFRNAPTESWGALALTAQDQLARLDDDPSVSHAHRQLAGLFFSTSVLGQLPENVSGESAWVTSLIQFRRNQIRQPDLQSMPDLHRELVRQRLLADGRDDQAARVRIAMFLESSGLLENPSLDLATCQLWTSRHSDAIVTIKGWLKNHGNQVDMLRAAELLGESKDPKSISAAVELLDQLAAGSAVASPLWHQAKLSAIELMYRHGQTTDAHKRAAYILITTPGLSSELRTKYQQYQR